MRQRIELDLVYNKAEKLLYEMNQVSKTWVKTAGPPKRDQVPEIA